MHVTEARSFWHWASAVIGLLVCVALAQAWFSRYDMNPDGVPYMEIADAYASGQWSDALNSYWGPLYSMLIAVAFRATSPGPAMRWPVVHLLNWLIFVFVAIAAALLVREYLRSIDAEAAAPPDDSQHRRLARWVAVAAAVVFALTALDWVGTDCVTPDLLLFGFTTLTATALLHVRRQPERWAAYVALGVALGLGYLTKSVMLPLAALCFALATWAVLPQVGWRRALPRLALSIALWAGVCGPFIAAVSMKSGRIVLAEAGRMNYVTFVSEYDGELDMLKSGRPLSVEVFPLGARGSLPWLRDPPTYFRGGSQHFDAGAQLGAIVRNLKAQNAEQAAVLVVGLLLCLHWTRRDRGTRRLWPPSSPAIVCILAAGILGLYMVVLVLPRYIGAAFFLAALGLACLPAVFGLRPAPLRGRWRTIAAGVLVVILTGVAIDLCLDLGKTIAEPEDTYLRHALAARELQMAGLQSGDRVAVVGRPYGFYCILLGGFQMGATVTPSPAYCGAAPDMRADLGSDLAEAGLRMLLTRDVDVTRAESGWMPAGEGSGVWYRPLHPAPAPDAGPDPHV